MVTCVAVQTISTPDSHYSVPDRHWTLLLNSGVDTRDKDYNVISHLDDLKGVNESSQQLETSSHYVLAGSRTTYNISTSSNQGNEVFPYDSLVQACDGDRVNSENLASNPLPCVPSNSTRQMGPQMEPRAQKLTNALREQEVVRSMEIGCPHQNVTSEGGGEAWGGGSDWSRARDIAGDPDQIPLVSSYPGYLPVRLDFGANLAPQAFSTPLQAHQGGRYPGHQGSGMQESSKSQSRRIVVKRQPYISNAWNGDSDIWTGDSCDSTGVSENGVTSGPQIKSGSLIIKDYLPKKSRRTHHTHHRRHTHDSHMDTNKVRSSQ